MTHEIVEIELDSLTTPKDGYIVMLNKYWVCRNGNPIAVKSPAGPKGWYKSAYSDSELYPQCNAQKHVAEHIAAVLYWGCEVRLIEAAYWPNYRS